jgi:hypothetical protein
MCRERLRAALVAGGMAAWAGARAQEIAPLKVTDEGARVDISYHLDDRSGTPVGLPEQFERTGTLEERLQLRSAGYLYHPNLARFRVEGGPLLVQQTYAANDGGERTHEALFDGALGLDLLSGKPYPVTLYAEQAHPAMTTSLAGRFLTEQTRIGATAALREPVLPWATNVEALRIDNHGHGFETTVDDRTSQAAVRMARSYHGGDWIELSHTGTQRQSASGTATLPIQRTRVTQRTTEADARNVFGAARQLDLTQHATYLDAQVREGPGVDQRDARYSGLLNWYHDPRTRSRYSLALGRGRVAGVPTESVILRAGATRSGAAGRSSDLDVHGSSDRNDGFVHRDVGVAGSTTLQKTSGPMTVRLSLSAVGDRVEQQASTDRVQLFDESVVLAGTNTVALHRPFVIDGSVVVRNAQKTQVYLLDTDYRLVTVGSTTSVQRLIGGAISDGETVLVDYEFRAGGTVGYNTLGGGYAVSATFYGRVEAYARQNVRHLRLTSGLPTIPLNSSNYSEIGLRSNYPVGRWLLGLELVRADEREDISPYRRSTAAATAQRDLPRSGALTLTLRRERVDNQGAREGVDLWQYVARVQSRPWAQLVAGLEADYLRDTGSVLAREHRGEALTLDWRYRAVHASLRAQYARESQGVVHRSQASAVAQLVREF